jgi:competence protein ComEA
MANRTGRARRRRAGALSLAQAEAELSEDVRRRLRAGSRAPAGWLPSPPDTEIERPAPDPTSPESVGTDAPDAVDAAVDDAVDGDAPLRSTGARLRATLSDRLPLGLRGADVAPSRAAAAGLAGLLAASLALALLLTWMHRPRESPAPPVRRSVPSSAVASLPSTATPSPDLLVHVAGAVRRPGLVELPAGSRVDAALSAAGGATRRADLASVNLARRLVDGEQIVVLRKGQGVAPLGAPGPPAEGSASPAQPVDLNTATLDQLDGLPGVGPVLAQRIIDWRTEHNRFSSVDELTEVSGIGERTLADLRPLVRV